MKDDDKFKMTRQGCRTKVEKERNEGRKGQTDRQKREREER